MRDLASYFPVLFIDTVSDSCGDEYSIPVCQMCEFNTSFLSALFTSYSIHCCLYGQLVCSVQFSSVAQSCPTLCNPMNCSTLGLPIHHQLPEFTQTHVHPVSDAIQPSHPLLSPSPPAPNPSQHQSLFQWVNCLHEVAKALEFQLQHHFFQRTPRTDLL